MIADNDLTRNWWEKVSKNVTTYITEYSVQHRVFERVESSYTLLPQHLQKCLLYLGVFPQDHEIHVWTLIRLWIVEGLILDSWGLTLDIAAQQNLYDLVSRNLVVVDKTHADGQIRTCHLHKLIYGFCKHKAAEEELYHEIKLSKGGALDSPMPLTSNHRRLCINSCLSEFLSSQPNGQCIRSILCHNKEDEVLPLEISFTVHKFFKLLKIFKCHGVKFRKFPEMLSKMILLRYISVSCCDSTGVIIIPESMASLCYLETLVVETELPTLEIRANIWKMPQLQNLVTKAAIVLTIKGKGKGKAGKNLQTLTRLAPASCTKEVLTRAPNLKKLGIRGRLSALDSNSSFKELKFLERLKLINEPAVSFQFPQEFFPPNLKRLTLSGTKLGWDSIPILGKIDDLEFLKLENNAFMGKKWNSTDGDGFVCLEFLLIKGTDLATWEASEHCFPRLKCLVLNNCAKLEKIPKTLESALAHRM